MRNGTSNNLNTLPSNLFTFRVPVIATYSEYEIEHFGVPTTVMKGKLKEEFDTMTTVMLTLDKVIDIYIMGYPVYLVKKEETVIMYKILEDYVRGVDNSDNYSINRVVSKDPRIADIDKFLSDVFTNNKPTVVRGTIGAGSGFNIGVSKMGIGGNVVTGKPVDTKPVGLMSGYEVGYQSNDKPVYDKVTASYINDNDPVIDMSKVKRTPITRVRRGVEHNNKD